MEIDNIHKDYRATVIELEELKKKPLKHYSFSEILYALEVRDRQLNQELRNVEKKVLRLKSRLGVYADSEVTPAEVVLLEKNEELEKENNILKKQITGLLAKPVDNSKVTP
jgi:hypothetical protein